ncbi:WxL protein peptidoglycan domain-containing protein [Homoserinibacter sp. GY 40078]|uniref:WxL protein peptidoglycan domain-containing protein n=1 Tax=Homoserinibacter sp. GY 40078 TaxID=2603275 RepID=UPI0011C898F7|nr:DUF916 domain-containing protein [Homoserinibacter sp. GY 40078]TXK19240.1 DUF916 domain-containing protein [Homoserinibacter sp. GY 40078]
MHALPARRRTTALLLTAAVAGLVLVPVASASADDGDVTWTVRTAENRFGDDRASFSYTLDPGSRVHDAMIVANKSDTDLSLGVYAADGYTTESGLFDLLVAGEESRNIGVWVTTTDDQVVVPAGETVEVPFTVEVPDDATPGDYAGGIVTSLVRPDEGEQIEVDRRLGIRIGLRVGGDLAPSLAVEGFHIDWNGSFDPFAGGDATIGYTLRNTGNAILTARQAATLTGPFGWFPQEVGALDDPPTLLPGEEWLVTTTVHDVPAVLLLAASVSVVPVVVDASGSTTPLDPVEASATGAAVPWTLIVVILLLAALVVAGLWFRSRRRILAQQREDARVQEAVELALAERSSTEG